VVAIGGGWWVVGDVWVVGGGWWVVVWCVVCGVWCVVVGGGNRTGYYMHTSGADNKTQTSPVNILRKNNYHIYTFYELPAGGGAKTYDYTMF
jgi:hypothetical protein